MRRLLPGLFLLFGSCSELFPHATASIAPTQPEDVLMAVAADVDEWAEMLMFLFGL